MNRHAPTVAVSLLLVALAGCDDNPEPRSLVLASWADDTIVPAFRTFADAAVAYAEQAEAFCAAPDATRLAAARGAWVGARSSWERVEVFRFGPYTDFPARLGSNIDFWPVRPDSIEEVLTGDAELTAASVALLGAPARGLPAAEYLLFAEGDGTLAAFETGRRCDYLVAAADDLAELADDIRAAWAPEEGGFVTELTGPYAGGMYMNPHEAFSEILNRMAFAVENIRRDDLGKPVGDVDGSASPGSVHSRYSGRAIGDIRDNLSMVRELFDGGEGGVGLVDMLRAREREDVIEVFELRFGAAMTALDAIPEPLDDAVVAAPNTVRDAIDALGALQRVIQADIVNAFGASLSFNDNDGD